MDVDKLLSDFSKKSREENYIHLERYVNDPKGFFSDHSDVDLRYSPEHGENTFLIPCAWLDRNTVFIIEDSPSDSIIKQIFVDDYVLFCGHPEFEHYLPESKKEISVSPTSSTRTLLTRSLQNNFFIKTDLDKHHFKFIRRLKGSSVKHSIEISRDLREFCNTDSCHNFSILPESLGLIYGDTESGTGVIYREMLPYPNEAQEKLLVPYFSLYSKDLKNDFDLPIQIQLLEISPNRNKLEVFIETMVFPLLKSWFDVFFERGLLLEMHGQNTLVELDSNGNLGRVVCRDFQSVYSDQNIRNERGLTCFSKHVVGTEDGIKPEEQYSHVYDNMIGNLLFKRMAKSFIQYYTQYQYPIVCSAIASCFKDISKNNLNNLFPATTFKFPDGPLSDNHVRFIDSGEKPLFR